MDSIVISRRDWRHGVVPCPRCGLHLDPNRDTNEKIIDDVPMLWTDVRGTHRRCVTPFLFEFRARARA